MMTYDDDLPPEAAGSQRLARAWFLAAPDLVAEHHRIQDRLEREGQWEYVGDVRDSDEFVLSEFDSHGQQLLHEQQAVLTQIDEVLLSKLRRGLLSAWARERSPLAPWRAVPPSAWRTLKFDNVRIGTARGPGTILFDVRIGIPVTPSEPDPVPAPHFSETGAPGRPSSMYLVVAEFERRVTAGQLEASVAREAATLAAWFKANCPGKAPLTAKAIENKIRADYRKHRPKGGTPPKL